MPDPVPGEGGQILTNAALQGIVGRTIVRARMDEPGKDDGAACERIDGERRPYEAWNYQGGDLELMLDDGTIVQVTGWGYDADGRVVCITKAAPDA